MINPNKTDSASPEPPDPVRERLEALRLAAWEEAERSTDHVFWSRFWSYVLLGAVVVGGLVATVSGSIASQEGDATWPGYAAAFAGAVVTACSAAAAKLKAVEKLKFALLQLADFKHVALQAENGLANGSGADLVTVLTDELTEIRRREPPD